MFVVLLVLCECIGVIVVNVDVFVCVDVVFVLFVECFDLLMSVIVIELVVMVCDGGVIVCGYDVEFDELCDILENCGQFLIDFEVCECVCIGIVNLCVEYNKVYGFYIEVMCGQIDKVFDDYCCCQMLKNVECYIMLELKIFEDKVLFVQECVLVCECVLYDLVLQVLLLFIFECQCVVLVFVEFDLFVVFVECVCVFDWVVLIFIDEIGIEIEQGCYLVVEVQVEQFIVNDCWFGFECKLLLIIGLNMGGKLMFMWQIVLIVLMVYVGSYVLVKLVCFGLIDWIFMCIGVVDDFVGGCLIFMVEMIEVVVIFNDVML